MESPDEVGRIAGSGLLNRLVWIDCDEQLNGDCAEGARVAIVAINISRRRESDGDRVEVGLLLRFPATLHSCAPHESESGKVCPWRLSNHPTKQRLPPLKSSSHRKFPHQFPLVKSYYCLPDSPPSARLSSSLPCPFFDLSSKRYVIISSLPSCIFPER